MTLQPGDRIFLSGCIANVNVDDLLAVGIKRLKQDAQSAEKEGGNETREFVVRGACRCQSKESFLDEC